MSGRAIDKKLNKAYAKLGKRLGYDFKLYRSVDYLDPIQEKNFVGTVSLAATIDENFKKQTDFNFHLFQLFCDSKDIQIGDIFVSDELGKRYTFVQKESITVPIGIESNQHITISRPAHVTINGTLRPSLVEYAQNIPCKILESTSAPSAGNMTEKTPGKSGIPQYEFWFYLDKEVKVNDQIVDSYGNKSNIQSVQRTPLGWKASSLSIKS